MRKLILIGLLFLLIPVNAFGYEKAEYYGSPIFYNAASVLVMDAETGEVLYETEGFALRYPASITKIMTALLVLERVEDLEELIVFSERSVDLPFYAGRMGMVEGESMTVLEALYGIMLPSANDIARALAEFVSGSIELFVEEMNIRAHQLGAHNTRFVNPCGLPGDGQFTTAYDIALIKREAIKHPLYVQIISTPYFTLPPTEFYEDPRLMRNSNVMVRPSREEFNPRVIGGKTGFTNAAQHTLVTYAAYDGFEIIISVLYASPRGAIFSDTAALVDYIFYNFPEELTEEIYEEEAEEEEEVVAVFAYVLSDVIEETVTETAEDEEVLLVEIREVSNSEAATVASMSILTAAGALLLVYAIRKLYIPKL